MSRYYDPVTHRFLNADGYLQAGEDILDVNMFAYCGNNPVCRIDSKGNSWWGIALACFATVAVCAVAVVAAPVIATAAVGVEISRHCFQRHNRFSRCSYNSYLCRCLCWC